jgi:predicted dehydrogenase
MSDTFAPPGMPDSSDLFTDSLNRRQFLVEALGLATATSLPSLGAEAPGPGQQTFRAAIMGNTGHGDYGHGLDLIFNGRENITVVAVADPNEAGRDKAAARAHALRRYADFRELIKREKPQLVSVAPRWSDQHHAMALAALRAGAHVFLEKPITRTLAEADELLAVAKRAGLKIAVAHQMRFAPNILFLKKLLEDGLIGDLLEIRAHGKQDQRAGGEDLIVLGIHLFDLMRFFAGDPLWCAGRVLQKGHDITLADAHPATENIGLIAGDDIFAQFAFPKGVHATFTSRAANRQAAGPWGLELIGTKGAVKILADIFPRIFALKNGAWSPNGKTDEWRPLEGDPTLQIQPQERGFDTANARVVDDWLAAISQDRDPICSGHAAMKALEMALAVFPAGLSRSRIELPLKDRNHPLVSQPDRAKRRN